MNAIDRDIHDQADGALRQQAVENLTERLHAGKTVRSLTLRDLIDADLSGPRAEFAALEVKNLLLADHGERGAKADAYVAGVIERYITTNPDLVEEEACEIEAHAEEDA